MEAVATDDDAADDGGPVLSAALDGGIAGSARVVAVEVANPDDVSADRAEPLVELEHAEAVNATTVSNTMDARMRMEKAWRTQPKYG
jgi:hypothetical protein